MDSILERERLLSQQNEQEKEGGAETQKETEEGEKCQPEDVTLFQKFKGIFCMCFTVIVLDKW